MEEILPVVLAPQGHAVVFMGIQASGKTTFYKEFFLDAGYIHINLDTIRTRRAEKNILNDCIKKNDSFVVDNTNPQKIDRERYILLAKEKGYRITGFFFQSIVRNSIERNRLREKPVPDKAIPCTSNKLEMPSLNEGFDELFFVSITPEGWNINPWRNK